MPREANARIFMAAFLIITKNMKTTYVYTEGRMDT